MTYTSGLHENVGSGKLLAIMERLQNLARQPSKIFTITTIFTKICVLENLQFINDVYFHGGNIVILSK